MLLKDSGVPDSTTQAIEKFKEALKDTPNDPIAIYSLAVMYQREGNLKRVIDLLKPLAVHEDNWTREKTLPMLLDAYERTGELMKAAQIKRELDK